MAPDHRDNDGPDDGSYIDRRDGTGELRLAWGNWSIGVRGPFVILVIGLLSLGAGLFYMNYLNVLAHDELIRAMLMQTCLSSLSAEEKAALRDAAKRDPRAWTDLLHYNCFYLKVPKSSVGFRWGGAADAGPRFPLDMRGTGATIVPTDRSRTQRRP